MVKTWNKVKNINKVKSWITKQKIIIYVPTDQVAPELKVSTAIQINECTLVFKLKIWNKVKKINAP